MSTTAFKAKGLISQAMTIESDIENINLDSIVNMGIGSSIENERNGGILQSDSIIIESLSFSKKKEKEKISPITPAPKKKVKENSSSSSYSPRRKHDSSAMSYLMPRDCQVDLDKDQIFKIGKDIHLSVVRTLENSRVKKNKSSVIGAQIQGKIEELQYKVRTLDGGSCNYKTDERNKHIVRKSLAEQSKEKKEEPKPLKDMTPY
jgi:hypothetical protein